MGAPLENVNSSSEEESSKSSFISIDETYTPEIIFVLCGQLGTHISTVAYIIKNLMENEFGYEKCDLITLSDFILQYKDKIDHTSLTPSKEKENKKFIEIRKKIEIGNSLRAKYGPSILADLAVQKISVDRMEYQKKKNSFTSSDKISIEQLSTDRRIAYVIDSIKNEEELKLLQHIYKDMLYFIGVSSPIESRMDSITNSNPDEKMTASELSTLIDLDSGQEIPNGQAVTKIIPLADFFLSINSENENDSKVKLFRFINLIFDTSIISPTPEETAMYLATSVAGNSACLSRQVGAVVTDKDGEIISVGWNDVPRFGGGLYDGNEPEGIKDNRCMNLLGGTCFNDQEKSSINKQISQNIKEHLTSLKFNHRLSNFDTESTEIFTEKVLSKLNKFFSDNIAADLNEILSKSKIADLIEFSRAIHAEMHAIITASQKAGDKVRGGKLFCTTYPCHNCGRHLVAAGIKEIYYIEPYRKSLTIKLHKDAISEKREFNKVALLPFEGVGPNKYLQLFDMLPNSRKKNGKRISKDKKLAKPKMAISLSAIPFLEAEIYRRLTKRFI